MGFVIEDLNSMTTKFEERMNAEKTKALSSGRYILPKSHSIVRMPLMGRKPAFGGKLAFKYDIV